jgi:hypothetical protein
MTTKKGIIFLLFFIFFQLNFALAQNELSLEDKRGVTVITHGFAAGGNLSEEWINFAKAVRKRAGKGSVFINHPETGLWEAVDDQNTNNKEDEIIFIYDWAWASDNLRSGYLDACADHLFAALLNPPKELNLNHTTALLEKPLHLIGHSRGAILLNVLAHKIGWYFKASPQIRIEQFTLIDPHPAGPMGDCDLPGILGLCPPPKDYESKDISLNLPRCVVRADNYFRQDGVYEDLITNKNFGPHDGISVSGLRGCNFQLNDKSLTYGSSTMGGAHASIATRWYYGTIDFENEYNHPIVESWYVEDDKFPAMGPRQKTGYFYSRLGGGIMPEPVLEEDKIEAVMPQNLLFNGDFKVERTLWKGKIPGWEGNGAAGEAKLSPQKYGDELAIRLERPKFNILKKSIHFRQHSLSYFPENIEGFTYEIQLEYEVKNKTKGNNSLKVSFFFPDNTEEIILKEINLSETKTDFKTVYIPTNPKMLGKVGAIRISLEGEDNNCMIDVKSVRLLKVAK